MNLYRHWKHGTIYALKAVAKPDSEDGKASREAEEYITATHHDTGELLAFPVAAEEVLSPDGEIYVLYHQRDKDGIWAREYEDFHGYKEKENETIKRFTPVRENEDGTVTELSTFESGEEAIWHDQQEYEREEVAIHIPGNFQDLVQDNFRSYKKWLRDHKALLKAVELAETEEEEEEARKAATQDFRTRFAGFIAKDSGIRLSPSQLKNIWENFMRKEYRSFLQAHRNLTMEDIVNLGVDKFVYVMGWKKPSDVSTWRSNKLRVGKCCHCNEQFIPLMFQYNHGLCANCRPEYSSPAIRKFIIHQMNVSKRYEKAQHDLMMDFYIMFYHDTDFRKLFLLNTDSANEIEKLKEEVPDWAKPKQVQENESSGL